MSAATMIVLNRLKTRRLEARRARDVLPVPPAQVAAILSPENQRKAARFVNLRQAHFYLESKAALKGFALYAWFFAFFFALWFHRFDITDGHETLTWYADAIQSDYDVAESDSPGWCLPGLLEGGASLDCYTKFTDLRTEAELISFIKYDLTRYISGVKKYCPECGIALTVQDRELGSIPEERVICSDFELAVGAQRTIGDLPIYPPRDCAAANAAFALKPDALSFPCCEHSSLRLAALALKVRAFLVALGSSVESGEGISIDALQRDEVVDAASAAYVALVLRAGGAFAQVVVRRDAHFVGIAYRASYVNDRWVPGIIEPSVRYWTRRYAHANGAVAVTSATLLTLALFGFCASTCHDLADLIGSQLSQRDLMLHLLSPYSVLVWLPTIVLPWWLSSLDNALGLTNFPLLVACVELVMFVRLFAEGQSLAPFRVIVRTLSSAARPLLTFCFAMATTITVFAAINSQISGAFDGTNSPFSSAFAASFDVVVQGAPLDSGASAVVPDAALLMYFVLNVALLLVLAQFFIAILVDAFDRARQAEEVKQLDRGVPPGFVSTACATLAERAMHDLRYHVLYVAFGAPAPLVQRRLLVLFRAATNAARERAAALGQPYEPAPLMVARADLSAALGHEATTALVRMFGAVIVPGNEAVVHAYLVPTGDIRPSAGGGGGRAGRTQVSDEEALDVQPGVCDGSSPRKAACVDACTAVNSVCARPVLTPTADRRMRRAQCAAAAGDTVADCAGACDDVSLSAQRSNRRRGARGAQHEGVWPPAEPGAGDDGELRVAHLTVRTSARRRQERRAAAAAAMSAPAEA
ncbi:hypothetical protein KFE25_012216 [Diacronema lutheri]|uniref:Uncharacterized protein n=1 Tax=Diacronema lutheri TaxID=2081491 RepID=A0A8J6C8Y7_DIALT|nr:hypothetical protein KFE25_012216 [Diacronema lutheri]